MMWMTTLRPSMERRRRMRGGGRRGSGRGRGKGRGRGNAMRPDTLKGLEAYPYASPIIIGKGPGGHLPGGGAVRWAGAGGLGSWGPGMGVRLPRLPVSMVPLCAFSLGWRGWEGWGGWVIHWML